MLGESKCEQAPQMPGQEVLERPTNTVYKQRTALCHCRGVETDLRGNIISAVLQLLKDTHQKPKYRSSASLQPPDSVQINNCWCSVSYATAHSSLQPGICSVQTPLGGVDRWWKTISHVSIKLPWRSSVLLLASQTVCILHVTHMSPLLFHQTSEHLLLVPSKNWHLVWNWQRQRERATQGDTEQF